MNRSVSTVWFLSTLLLAGCGSAPPAGAKKTDAKKGDAKKGDDAAPAGMLVIEADKLPALTEDALEGIDDGRLTVRGPEGWKREPRGPKYLAKYAQSDKAPFPQIIITGYDSSEPADLTEENVAAYAEARQIEVLKEVKKASIGQDFRPIKLPKGVGVYYVRKGQIENILVERAIITLIRGGKRYDVETRSVPANIQEFEKFGQAVANGLEWK